MTRLEANLKIVDILSSYLKANPDQRFCQALCNLGLPCIKSIEGRDVDMYYEESDKTLETVKEKIQSKVEYQWNPRSQRHEKVQV